MAESEFQIPLKPEDLLSAEDPIEEIELSCVVDRLCEQATTICDHENLDVLFALVRSYSDLDDHVKCRLFDVLLSGLSCLSAHVDRLSLEYANGSDDGDERRLVRNAFRVHIFLLKWFMSLAEKDSGESSTEHNKASKAGGKGAKGSAKSTANKRGGRIIENWSWDTQRTSLMSSLSKAIQADVCRLWSPRRPEEALGAQLVHMAMMTLTNPNAAKDKDCRAAAQRVIVRCVQVLGQRSHAVTSLVNLLQQCEHAAAVVAELVASAAAGGSDWHSNGAGSGGEAAFVGDVMREVGRLPMQELARDAGAGRGVSQFVCEVAEAAPGVVLLHMSVLNPHLQQGESYLMRNAVLHAVGFALIELAAITRRERSDTALKTRDSLLQMLKERAHDVNAFTRSKVLQVWSLLTEREAIPTKTLPALAHMAAARLEDKSAQVRKSAMQLLKHLVQKNPYSPTLPLSVFKAKLSEAETLLAQAETAAVAAINSLAPAVTAVNAAATDSPRESKESEAREEQEESESDEEEQGKEEEKVAEAGACGKGGEGGAAAAEAVAEAGVVEEKRTRVQFYTQAVGFINGVHGAVTRVEELLRSKTTSDVVEAVELLVALVPFQLELAEQALRRMLLLVWSKEAPVRDAVVTAYAALFLSPPDSGWTKPVLAATAGRLAALTVGATVGELASLERLMALLLVSPGLPAGLVHALWDMYTSSNNKQASAPAGILLSLCAGGLADSLWPRLRSLMDSPSAMAGVKADPVRARALCVMCERVAAGGRIGAGERGVVEKVLCELVVVEPPDAADDRWLPAAEQALNALYTLHPEPHVPAGQVLRSLALQSLTPEALPSASSCSPSCHDSHVHPASSPSCESWRLARFLFLIGHVAMKQLAFVESLAAAQSRDAPPPPAPPAPARASEEAAEGGRSKKKATKKGKAGRGGDSSDEEGSAPAAGGRGGAGAEEDLAAQVGTADAAVQETRTEAAREAAEKELVSAEGLVGVLAATVRRVCLNASGRFGDGRVRAAGVAALCKLMCVSSRLCEDNLQLLFSIMVAAPEPAVRCNVVVALGDLAFRWTNLTEPWMGHVYALLRDDDPAVRRNTLTVLTHLILNDMVKVRGQIGEMALCLEDGEEAIQDMARVFFGEFRLKQQGLVLYNLLPDMIGRLSAGEGVEEGRFRRVMRYVLGLIDKAKQTDALVDRLCQRLRSTDRPRQWRDTAFCLAQLTCSDKGLRRLCDEANWRALATAMQDDDVAASLAAVVARARKLPRPAEGPSVADELAQRMEAARALVPPPQDGAEAPADGDEGPRPAASAPVAAAGRGKTSKAAPRKGAAARGKGRGRKGARSESDSDGIPSDSEDEAPPPSRTARAAATRQPARAAAAKSKRRAAADSDEESEEEEEGGKGEGEEGEAGDNPKHKNKENTSSNRSRRPAPAPAAKAAPAVAVKAETSRRTRA